MTIQGNASNRNDGEHNNKKGDRHEPDAVPIDYPSAEQKARERGRWVKEAMLKGAVSGTIREALREVRDHLDF